MDRRHPTRFAILFFVATASLVGVEPSSTRADPPPVSGFFDAEPSLAWIPANDTVVLAFDDQSGAFDLSNGALQPKVSPTWAGVAVSHDHGGTWSRGTPIPPASENCGDPTCATSLLGAPLVVRDLDDARVFYASLAATPARGANVPFPDAVAVSLSKDGVAWAAPRVALEMPQGIADKYSIDAGYHSVTVVASSKADGELYMVSADAIEDTPVFGAVSRIDLGDAGVRKARPVLRLRDPYNGYLAYMLPRDSLNSIFDVVVVRVTRFKKVPIAAPPGFEIEVVPWFSEKVVFRRDGLAINPIIPGALGRRWRDLYPITLADGSPFGDHPYFAVREFRPDFGRSVITTYDCDDSNNLCRADQGNLGWNVHEFDDCGAHGDQLQPTLAAEKYGYRVSLAWYEQISGDPTDPRITLKGISSEDGRGWSGITDLHYGAPWAPCPSGDAPSFSVGTYGDSFGSLILADGTHVTAHTSSNTCVDQGALTNDQHVATVVW